jgi:cytochrome c5
MLLKAKLIVVLLLAQAPAQAPPAEMAKKLEASCFGLCHGPSLIAQQRLDRNGWTREIDKMTRWGAPVQAPDRDALINYLARQFNSNRPLPNSAKAVPEGKGSDLFQTYCLGCHNDSLVTSRKLDKTGWNAVVDQMMRWGAYIPTGRKDELIDYLATHWGK